MGAQILKITPGIPEMHWCDDCMTSGGYVTSLYVMRDDGPARVGRLRGCVGCNPPEGDDDD